MTQMLTVQRLKQKKNQPLRKWRNDGWYQIVGLVVILTVWQISALIINLGDAYPGPFTVVPELMKLVSSGSAWTALLSTLTRTFGGFAIAFVLAVAYGLWCYRMPVVRDYTNGLFNIIFFTPSLIIIFVGIMAFGQNYFAVMLVVMLAIFSDIGVYMRDAFSNFDEGIANMAKAYKASLGQRVMSVYLPFLAPAMLITARSGFTLAWKTAFLAEIFAFPDGLGWALRSAYRVYDMPQMLAWLALFIAALLVIEQFMRWVEKKAIKWK